MSAGIANLAHQRAWRERVRGTPPPVHGRTGYLFYGCRCEACKAAERTYRAELAKRTPPCGCRRCRP